MIASNKCQGVTERKIHTFRTRVLMNKTLSDRTVGEYYKVHFCLQDTRGTQYGMKAMSPELLQRSKVKFRKTMKNSSGGQY